MEKSADNEKSITYRVYTHSKDLLMKANQDIPTGETNWPWFYSEPEVRIPLILWTDFLEGTLEKMMHIINSTEYPEETLYTEIRPMLSELLCFFGYVESEHMP